MANFGGLAPGNAADPDAPPDIFAAFEQQLGLKLGSTKAFVDVMVIEKNREAFGELTALASEDSLRRLKPGENRRCPRSKDGFYTAAKAAVGDGAAPCGAS